MKEEGHEKSAATKLKEKEKEIQHKKELKIQAQEMAEQFEVEKKEALEQQRADFLLELKVSFLVLHSSSLTTSLYMTLHYRQGTTR